MEYLGARIIVFLIYVSMAILAVVMLAVGTALGLRWGLTWALKKISKDSELEAWLKRVLNNSEKSEL